MLNDSIPLPFKLSVASGTFGIRLNDFPCHGNILIPLMAEDYILKGGGGNAFESIWKISLL